MSALRQRAAALLGSYDQTLEKQILGRGSCLACGDEQLRMEVEGWLRDSDPRETHCLGLDPLRVMEESLKAPPPYGRRGNARRGLQGLAKAFEVLEQAALNLYLGPWRKEYKVIKMYSGTFTHYIAPVLSTPQTEKLFGLLGYQAGPSRLQLLCLRSPRVGPASPEDLLRLACAFFVARCECRLLVSALGKRGGDVQWELNVVRERQRGHVLQVAVDNTEMQLVDLYTAGQINGGQKDEPVSDDEEDRQTSFRVYQDSTAPPGVQRHRNGPASPVLDPDSRSSSASSRSKLSHEEPQQVEVPGPVRSALNYSCSCLRTPPLRLQRCVDCNALHDITCGYLSDGCADQHRVENADDPPETSGEEPKAPSRQLLDGVHDVPGPETQPIGYHCASAEGDPQLLCHTCNVFHGSSCVEGKLCRTRHETSRLGTCSCGKACTRKPLILCHYCGNEYCSQCWYKNPLTCSCGQTFDPSTSV